MLTCTWVVSKDSLRRAALKERGGEDVAVDSGPERCSVYSIFSSLLPPNRHQQTPNLGCGLRAPSPQTSRCRDSSPGEVSLHQIRAWMDTHPAPGESGHHNPILRRGPHFPQRALIPLLRAYCMLLSASLPALDIEDSLNKLLHPNILSLCPLESTSETF